MGLYDKYFLAPFINCACGTKPILYQRKKVAPLCEGRVLEVGMGSALNLPYYDRNKVEFIWGLEPSEAMREKSRPNIESSGLDVKLIDLPGEEIPLEDDSVDSILLTYTLCTIPDWSTALQQMRRVLKPGGKLVFTEHGEAPDEGVLNWQNRINPLWKKLAGGCNLNRKIPQLLTDSGFAIDELDAMYLPSTPKLFAYNYWGVASIA
ncbi:MAG TPA: SAM-dependent methyltransferase [Porticoccaceae bacterium]|nr:SAM-dependent methyltransferase [Porticoccaceae bacterium]HCO61319.1 SAM-dependent methyltransferase [Porticoccaceae bacterium]